MKKVEIHFHLTVLFLATFLLLVSPLGVHAQKKEYTGTIRPFVMEAESFPSVDAQSLRESAPSKLSFMLEDSSGRFIPLADNPLWGQYANREVAFTGYTIRNGKSKLVTTKEESIQTLSYAPNDFYTVPPVTQGDYKVLAVVVKVRQPGQPEPPDILTAEEALAPIFHSERSGRNFLFTASGGRLTLSGHLNPQQGDVVFVTINATVTNCTNNVYTVFLPLIDDQIRAKGIDPNWYNTNVIIFDYEHMGCNGMSLGSLGVIGQIGRREYVLTSKTDLLWPAAEYIISHEIGHNIGLQHSDAYDCTDPNNIPGSCAVIQYGDKFCVMGSGNLYLPNSYQRHRLGWYSGTFRQIGGGQYKFFSPSLTTVNSRFYTCQFCAVPLSGNLSGYSLYPESRMNYPPYDLFYGPEWYYWAYEQGIKLIIGIDDLALYYAKPYLVDTMPGDRDTVNAPLVLSSYTLGGVKIEHMFITTPTTGSGVKINMLNANRGTKP